MKALVEKIAKLQQKFESDMTRNNARKLKDAKLQLLELTKKEEKPAYLEDERYIRMVNRFECSKNRLSNLIMD